MQRFAFLDKIGKAFYNKQQETINRTQREKWGVNMGERATIEQFIHSVGNFSRFQDRVPLCMSQGEPFVLNYLYCHDSAQPSQISVAMQVSTARITTILNGLEKRGLVVRQPDQTDRRKINVCLTEQGRSYAVQAREEVMGLLSDILTRLGPEDTAELLRILDRLTEICDGLPTGRRPSSD